MTVLVTGGAGYIGSHVVWLLLRQGYQVVVYDNLSRGHAAAVPPEVELVRGDVADTARLGAALSDFGIEAIMHFAADSQVGESMHNPSKYFQNNLAGGITLLGTALEHGVKNFIFSSTAAVYGEPTQVPITEEHQVSPANPYGATKAAVENVLRWYDQAYNFKSVSLRYFNAAGADPSGKIGEDHEPETHLIPIMLQCAAGLRDKLTIFGDDYPTQDGTAVRDYIHVNDLASAHVLALEYLLNGGATAAFNLGSEQGYSVRAMVDAAIKVTGVEFPWTVGPRRQGDPAVLIASSQKARQILGWQPQFERLETIIETAWNWHRNHPKGYEEE